MARKEYKRPKKSGNSFPPPPQTGSTNDQTPISTAQTHDSATSPQGQSSASGNQNNSGHSFENFIILPPQSQLQNSNNRMEGQDLQTSLNFTRIYSASHQQHEERVRRLESHQDTPPPQTTTFDLEAQSTTLKKSFWRIIFLLRGIICSVFTSYDT